jgi:hypothetical protein
VYTGTLNARVATSALEFETPQSLTGGEFGPLTITGKESLKGAGKNKVITAA